VITTHREDHGPQADPRGFEVLMNIDEICLNFSALVPMIRPVFAPASATAKAMQ
jgi:hypothetical protein